MKKSIFLFFAAILCAFSTNVQAADLKGGEVVLLKPGTNWKKDNARFAVYFFNNSTSKNQWVGMTKVDGETDLYYAIAPSGTWKNLIYCRMNPGNATNDWGSKWNQSGDLTWTNTNSLFTVANSTWDGATTTWSAKKVASTGKLTASSTNVSENEAVTLTPALTSNTAINTIQSTTYSISPATGASIDGNTFTATAAGTYTVTATIKYRLNGYTSSTFESTVDATTIITVTSAAEPKHDVTVSWKCGETELQASQTLSVGESTANTAEAPEFKDYTFSGWDLGSGVQSADANANPISITTKASGDYTLTAKYTYIEPIIKTIYCKMEYSWWTQASAAISAFISGTYGESATSLGTLMTLAPLESNVWKIDVDVARYQKIKFIRVNPEGTSDWGAHTGLVEIPVDEKNLYTITEENTNNDKWGTDCPGTWSVYEAPAAAPKRYITGAKELVGGEGWKANEIEMAYDNTLSTYSYTFLASALTTGTEYKLKITDGTWDNHWGALNGTIEGVSNDGDGNVCFKLSTVGDVTVTFDGAKITLSTTGAFYVPTVYDYYIAGSMNGWAQNDENYGMSKVGETTTYAKELTLAVGTYEFKVKGTAWYGYADITGEYTEISEGKDGEGNPNGNIQLTLAAEKTFTVNFDSNTKKVSFLGLTEIIPTYTIVGTTEITGVNWDPANAENLMAKDGEAYTLTKTGLKLVAGDYNYKVAKNGAWGDGEYPASGDQTLNIAENGEYTIVYTYTVGTSLTAVATKTGEYTPAPVEVKYYLVGTMNSWTNGDATYELSLEGDGLYHYNVTLNIGTHEFKVYDATGVNTYGYAQLTKKNYNELSEGEYSNIKLTLAANAEVTITFNGETKAITLTSTALTENVAALTYTVTVPAGTAKCYICGAWDWNTFMEMTPTANANEFTIDIVGATAEQQYKYTRGEGWEYAEVNADGSTRANRTYNANDVVEKWADVITYVLMGVNGDWTTGIALTKNPGNEDEYVLENQVVIKATDAVKVVTLTNGTASAWCGDVDSWSNATYTADADGNIVLEDGIYSFYFKKSANNIYINQTGYARTVTNKYGTICLPNASASTTGAIFYRVVGKETGKVYLESVDALEAGVPYIFEATASTITVTYQGEAVLAPQNDDANGLIGTFTNETVVPDGDYILYNNAFCTNESAGTLNKINANRAYLDMDAVTGGKPQQMPGRRYIGMSTQGENAETGLENIIVPEGQAVKVISNGQLIIIRDGEMYNAQGQKL